MAITLNQLDLVARDMNATISFYRLLGAKLPKRAFGSTASGIHHVRVGFKGGMELAFDSPALARAYNKGYRGGGTGGGVVIGFGVATRRAVDATYARLTKARHKGLMPPFDAFWGTRYAIVADPDGNHVGIMSPVDPGKRSPGPE
jgi:uncharacterized glyoxalase superfamily protein PhnB